MQELLFKDLEGILREAIETYEPRLREPDYEGYTEGILRELNLPKMIETIIHLADVAVSEVENERYWRCKREGF